MKIERQQGSFRQAPSSIHLRWPTLLTQPSSVSSSTSILLYTASSITTDYTQPHEYAMPAVRDIVRDPSVFAMRRTRLRALTRKSHIPTILRPLHIYAPQSLYSAGYKERSTKLWQRVDYDNFPLLLLTDSATLFKHSNIYAHTI